MYNHSMYSNPVSCSCVLLLLYCHIHNIIIIIILYLIYVTWQYKGSFVILYVHLSYIVFPIQFNSCLRVVLYITF